MNKVPNLIQTNDFQRRTLRCFSNQTNATAPNKPRSLLGDRSVGPPIFNHDVAVKVLVLDPDGVDLSVDLAPDPLRLPLGQASFSVTVPA